MVEPYPILKNDGVKVSWDDEIPNMNGKIKFIFQSPPTSNDVYYHGFYHGFYHRFYHIYDTIHDKYMFLSKPSITIHNHPWSSMVLFSRKKHKPVSLCIFTSSLKWKYTQCSPTQNVWRFFGDFRVQLQRAQSSGPESPEPKKMATLGFRIWLGI